MCLESQAAAVSVEPSEMIPLRTWRWTFDPVDGVAVEEVLSEAGSNVSALS